tara:strand:- start:105 stop:1112 length:1008 start_codon:yes stop_codon:yes gene_type:complete
LGGLARKATILDQSSLEVENFYVIDAGNLFFKKSEIDEGVTMEAAKINAQIILDSFNAMGCNAFSPGEFDFSGGLDYLLSLEKQAEFPFTSCNITNKYGKQLFKEYILDKNSDFSIAFIGLSSKFESSEVNIEDPVESIKSVLKKLKNKSDINVLMFHGDDNDLRNIYNENLDIDLIVRSKDRKRSSDGGNKIPTFSLGDRGKILYQFDLIYKDLKQELTDIAWCQNTENRISDRLEKMKKGDLLADLNDLYKDNPATLRRIANYEDQINMANEKMKNLVNELKFEKIELGKNIDGRIDILQIVDTGKIYLEETLGPMLPKPVPHDHDGDGIPDH